MTTYDRGGSIGRDLVTWLLVGILAIVALKLALLVIGSVFSVGLFLALTVGPILIVGWLAIKVLRRFSRGSDFDSI